ncbi:MAG: YkuS family protein [Clostridiales bacterium]|nr:YkuS family protein [Clostridiales bacterium]
MKNIAIEKGLSSVKNYLQSQGYSVREFDLSKNNDTTLLGSVDAVVVAGVNTNFTALDAKVTNAPIIEAAGLSPEEVKEEIEERVG